MPRRRNPKFKKKPRKIYRRKKSSKMTTYGKSMFGPIAPRYVGQLKYVEELIISLSSSITSDYVFNLNSLFDPNQTSTGHQPYGYDTLTTLYNRYRVYKTGYKITVYPTVSVNGTTWIVLNNSQSSMGGTDQTLLSEWPRARSYNWRLDDPVVIKGFASLPKITGVSSEQYRTDDRFQATVSSSPTEQICLHMVNNSPTAGTYRIRVELYFHSEFWDPINLSQS